MQCPWADPVQTIACWNIILRIKGRRAVRLKRFAGGELGIMTGSRSCRLERKSRQVGLSTPTLERFYVGARARARTSKPALGMRQFIQLAYTGMVAPLGVEPRTWV